LLGLTNHWMTLIGHKFNDKIEFYYLDSRNFDYIDAKDEGEAYAQYLRDD